MKHLTTVSTFFLLYLSKPSLKSGYVSLITLSARVLCEELGHPYLCANISSKNLMINMDTVRILLMHSVINYNCATVMEH
jgi:hypothetical protein